MIKLERLINKLCPDGVKYVKIGDIVNYEQPTKYIVKNTDYCDKFNIPVLTAGQTFILGYTNEENNIYQATEENPVIIFDDFTGAFKWVDFPFKVKSSAMKILTADKSKTFIRYIFHIMGKIVFSSNEHKRLWINLYSKFKIPLPSIEIQTEIVRILDKYSASVAELRQMLEKELNLRKKQYEYYRDYLLDFGDDVEWKRLGEIAEVTDYVANGSFASLKENVTYKRQPDYAVLLRTVDFSTRFDRDNMIYIDEKAYNFLGKSKLFGGEIIINNIGAGVGNSFICPDLKIKMSLAPNSVMLKTSNNKFYFYWLNSKYGKNALSNIISKSAMPKFNKTGLRNILIPIPPIEEQERIVKILDHFDTLCNDLTNGLPAEIEARQKQYEYYRNKILTFKEA